MIQLVIYFLKTILFYFILFFVQQSSPISESSSLLTIILISVGVCVCLTLIIVAVVCILTSKNKDDESKQKWTLEIQKKNLKIILKIDSIEQACDNNMVSARNENRKYNIIIFLFFKKKKIKTISKNIVENQEQLG